MTYGFVQRIGPLIEPNKEGAYLIIIVQVITAPDKMHGMWPVLRIC